MARECELRKRSEIDLNIFDKIMGKIKRSEAQKYAKQQKRQEQMQSAAASQKEEATGKYQIQETDPAATRQPLKGSLQEFQIQN